MSSDASTSIPNDHQVKLKLSLASNGTTSRLGVHQHQSDEETEQDEAIEEIENPDDQKRWTAAARQRHEADLLEHHYEAPKADCVENDWQTAYVWAYIVKFEQRDRIRKLACLEDFEHSLVEPVANRPDDVLEGILIRFLSNLKPGLRNLDCTNIQNHLSNYISEMLLHSTEFTVWDRPWAPNEEARAGCCNQSAARHELGRLRYPGEPLADRGAKNPIKRIEEQGGGLFELDWRERVKLLRQLVDWQLTLSDPVRSIINRANKVNESRGKKEGKEVVDLDILTEPLGQDRDKNRIWSFDYSGRLYKSGNPYKRPCPLIALSSNRNEMQTLLDRFTDHGAQLAVKLKGSGAKGKPTMAQASAHRKLLKGIEDEKRLAERLQELAPAMEKEEARIERARRKIVAASEVAQLAESRTTRTRRPTRKVDYTYDGEEDDDDEATPKRSRNETDDYEQTDFRGRPIIPGERKSARNAQLDANETFSLGDDGASSTSGRGREGASSSVAVSNGSGPGRLKGMKGYAYVPDERPFERLTPKERKQLAQDQAKALNEMSWSVKGEDGAEGYIGDR